MELGAREDQALGGVAKPVLAPPLSSVTFADGASTGLSITYVNEGVKLEIICIHRSVVGWANLIDSSHFLDRSGDLKRHKCDSVRSKTGLIPQAPIKCQKCRRTFRRSGDFKRHKCDSVRSKTGPSTSSGGMGGGGGGQRKKGQK